MQRTCSLQRSIRAQEALNVLIRHKSDNDNDVLLRLSFPWSRARTVPVEINRVFSGTQE